MLDSTLSFYFYMFDSPLLLEQIQNSTIAAKEAEHGDHTQPEYHFSVLLAHVRGLPTEWNSDVQKLLRIDAHPSFEMLLQSLSLDIESSGSVPSRLATFQALLRLTIAVYAVKTGQRSTGP